LTFHNKQGKYLTLTSAQPDARFGALKIDENNMVLSFEEKPKGDGSWINAGFFVCNPEVFSYIKNGDETIFERDPLVNLANDGQIYTYKHDSFWMPMDTLRDKNILNDLVINGNAPWIKW
jgi:glucose-1-phosphate cytidylyltransferase